MTFDAKISNKTIMKNNNFSPIYSDTHAIILAAGLGTRLKENTKEKPKCLVPVSGKPILERMLENLEKLGLQRITIVVGYLHQEIRNFVAQWMQSKASTMEIDFVLNERYAQSGSVFSLERALRATDAMRTQKDLLLIEGDVVIDMRLLHRLLQQGVLGKDAATLLEPYQPWLNGTFATVEEGIVSAWLHESVRSQDFDLVKSLKTVNLTFVRRGEARERLLTQVSNVIGQSGVKAPLEYAMQNLVDGGLQIDAVLTDGLPWFEVDTPEDLKIAEELFPALKEIPG